MLKRRWTTGCLFVACVIGVRALFAEPAPKSSYEAETQIARAIIIEEEDENGDGDNEPAKPAAKRVEITEAQATATHTQTRIIKPQHDGKSVTLATFCLASNGNLLACVEPKSPKRAGDDSDTSESTASFIQIYSPEGKLLEEIPVPFKATAINVAPKGTVFVAGQGKMAKIVDGKVSQVVNGPHIGNYDELKAKVLAAAKEENKEYCQQFQDQIDLFQKQIDQIEEKGKNGELTKREQAQITSLKSSVKLYEEQIKNFGNNGANPETLVRDRLFVTGLAATDKDVFISVRSLEGRGFDVWRTNHDFQEGKNVVKKVSGCCRQLDIQAQNDHLLIAENGKFEVSIRDRDGKPLTGFGKRDRSAVDGFGSCCNPMNIRCCSNGDILAAESSIGNIKRFNAKGEFVGLVGKARVGVGCKHVALAFDESRNRYYMMHEDNSHIAVLIPRNEVPAPTEEVKAASAARAEFSKQLVGHWNRADVKPAQGVKASVEAAVKTLFGDDSDDDFNSNGPLFDQVAFASDGKLTFKGGLYQNYFGNNGTWEAVELVDNTLEIAFLQEGAEYFHARVQIISDDEMKIQVQNFGDEEFGKPISCRRDKSANGVKTTQKTR